MLVLLIVYVIVANKERLVIVGQGRTRRHSCQSAKG